MPATTSLDKIQAAGPDLVITLPDGQVYVIVNGAVEVPELIVGNVRIPPANIAALLLGQEPEPAAGAPRSSGGNFAQEIHDIADAFRVGDLLGGSDLDFAQTDDGMQVVNQGIDNAVVVTITSPNAVDGVIDAAATVAEAGLPARGDKPQGTDDDASGETVSGTIRMDALDGIASVRINGSEVSDVGETIQTRYGELLITSITATEIGYTYTLIDNTTDPAATDVITVMVTDSDGDVGQATLTIDFADDVPTARADHADVAAGDFEAQTGNVITGAGTISGPTGLDTPGADGATVTSVRAGSQGAQAGAGVEVAGQYGTLVIAANGDYTYVRNHGTPGGGTESFTYVLTDGDGDTSTATLSFTIDDGGVNITAVPEGDDAAVSEAGLPPRGSEAAGSDEAGSSETATGTIEYYAPDGATVVINGETIREVGQVIPTALGRLVITAIAEGAVSYSFTLTDNTSGDFTGEELTITVTDLDGDSDTTTMILNVIDDAPTAADDDAALTVDEQSAAGNVMTDGEGADTPGADGASVTGVAFGDAQAGAGAEIAGAYGVLVIAADGSYRYTLDPANAFMRELAAGETVSEQFTYTLTDGDGDTTTATLAITITGSDQGDGVLSIEGVTDGTVSESGLPQGSAPDAEVRTSQGVFTVNAADGLDRLTVGGETVFDGAPVIGAVIESDLGRLQIVSVTPQLGETGKVVSVTIAYAYTLTGSADHADGVEPSDSFPVVATDSDGSEVSEALVIAVLDDAPVATDDAATLTADAAEVLGNVLETDAQGADGASVTAGTFDGTYGQLVIEADGSYRYVPNSDNALLRELAGGESLVEDFTYTLTDGDGDTTTASLVITITGSDDGLTIDGLAGEGPDGTVSEAGLAGGSATDADAVRAEGSFTIAAADGLATVTIGGKTVFAGEPIEGETIDTALGRLEIVSVTPETGESGKTIALTITYVYTLDHSGSAPSETFEIVATDTDGTELSDSLVVAVVDDAPTAVAGAPITVAEDGAVVSGNLLGDDTPGADGARVTSVTIDGEQVSVAAVGATTHATAKGVYTFQADGSWSFDPASIVSGGGVGAHFDYTITDGDGDTASARQVITITDGTGPKAGASIKLVVGDQQLADGSAPAEDQPAHAAGTITFTPGSDAIASIAFGDISQLDGGLDWSRNGNTITGKFGSTPVVKLTLAVDGNGATVTATLLDNYGMHGEPGIDVAALGRISVVATDADGTQAMAQVSVSITDDVPTITASPFAPGALTVDESDLSVNATADFRALLDARFNGDGEGSIVYRLQQGNTAGLVDAATGAGIGLFGQQNDDGDVHSIIGYVIGGSNQVAFVLSIDADGIITLDQQRAVRHPNGSDPDDAVTVIQGAIKLYATITDGDGDTAEVEVDLAGALVFRDDGPQLEIARADNDTLTITTHDAPPVGAISDVATRDFSSAFKVSESPAGADGAAQIAWTYSLSLGSGASASGLTSDGVAVTLAVVGNKIVGSAGGNPVFSIEVDAATGVVKVTQSAPLDHPLPGSAGSYADQIIALANNLVLLEGRATITDRDGDTMSQALTIDLGGNIRFADAGPSVTVTGAVPTLEVSETFLNIDAQKDMSGLFTPDHGVDGPGSITYALGVKAGDSGLTDTLSSEKVFLSISGGTVYGKTETSGEVVFKISVDANGVVTFDQLRSIAHRSDIGLGEARGLVGNQLVTLTAAVTDGDGDTASATRDITSSFVIKDDAPHAVADRDDVSRDGNVVADGNVLRGGGGVDLNDTDGSADQLSADGPVYVEKFSFGGNIRTAGADSLDGVHGSLQIDIFGNYRYKLNETDPAVIALKPSETLEESFTYTIVDIDGDRSTATITITISGTNDRPTAKADSNWVKDGPLGSDPVVSGNVLHTTPHPNAPGGQFGDVADIDPQGDVLTVANPDTTPGLYGTLILDSSGNYTYQLNANHPAVNALDDGQTLTETFDYTATDGTRSSASTLTITIFGTNDAPTVGTSFARVSEEGLAGGRPDAGPDAVSDTTDSAVATGQINIADPDAGETLTVTLGDPGAVLTAGGQPVVWSGVGTHTLTGSVSGQPVITVTIDNAGAYSVTLHKGVDHSAIDTEDLKSFSVPVRVSDGTVTTTNPTALTITIEDDKPVAIGESGSSSQPHQDVNALFVLDFSISMDDAELNKMITAVKNALTRLDAATADDLSIKFVVFANSAMASPEFASAAAANAWLMGINPADGGTRPSSIGLGTNYTVAIESALANYDAVPGANNQVVFISDGNPLSGVQFGGTPPVVVNSLQNATAAKWNAFVDGNGVGVTAIGINNDPLSQINIQRLADIDVNAAPNNQPILIDDFDALMSTLLTVIVPPTLSGALDANDFYGADGGRLLSITIGSTTYTWDGASTVSVSGGNPIAGTSIDATTPHGGTLHLDFATGQYRYDPPSPITATTTETFTYTLVDRDGDTASASLQVSLNVSAPPVVLDLDGDGLEFVAADAGAHFDFGGDGTAENTAWVGRDDGLLAIDANGDGKVSAAAEIVFAQPGLTDLQGLAARYDSNRDGLLDAQDADFAKFGVWQDANGNGVADAGEFATLSERGIVSLDLTGAGRSYRAADGQVLVHAETSFTRADGSNGKAADVAFSTHVVQEQERSAANTSTMGGAMLAAGLIATAAQAAAEEPAPSQSAELGRDAAASIDASAPATNVGDTTDTAPSVGAADAAESTVEVSRQPAHDAPHHDAEPVAEAADASPQAHTVGDLLAQAFDMESLNLPAPQDAPGFAAAPAAGPLPEATVAAIVADALAEGAPDSPVDRLIDALKQSATVGDGGPPASTDQTGQAEAQGVAALLQPHGDVPPGIMDSPIDWSAAHQVLAEQHVAVQLDAAAAGHG